ncbi:MAG: D-aminoacyl-tRNA deacylase [Candidatus Poseidoniales archaeon]
MVALIVISGGDIASYNQANALLEMADWSELDPVEGHRALAFSNARIWWFPEGVLWENDLDKRWTAATGEIPTEVIFPSRHSAASGQASLTLHPIGTMQVEPDDVPEYGGKAGDCPPPNPRIAAWWRELNRIGSQLEEFDLSLEATHHGPWLETPSLFIEIGSTKATWGHLGAAKLLAGIIHRGLGLDGGNGFGNWDGDGKVVITLGGGHYAPRANKIALDKDVFLGHILATYAIPFSRDEDENITGMWEHSIRAAVSSTKIAYPGAQLLCSIEKKAFKGWQRQLIRDLMAALDIPILRTRDLIG